MTIWKFCVNCQQVSSGQESNEARFCEHRCWQTRKSAHNKICPRIPLDLLHFAINLIFISSRKIHNVVQCARHWSRRQQFRWKWLNIEISEVFNDQQTKTLLLSDNMVQFLRIWFCNQESLSEGTKSWSPSWLIDRRRLSEVDTW